ncbi:hypothetical protein [Brucella sp. LJL56]
MFIFLSSHNKSLFYSIFFMISGVLAGCTTIRPTEMCTPTEQKQLKKQLLVTQSLLDRKEMDLSRLRKTITEDRCLGGVFTPAVKSSQCTTLLTRTDRLATETQTLRERLHELNMALAGRPSPSRHVKSCKVSWVVLHKKPQAKTAHVPQRKIAKPSAELTSKITLPAYASPNPVEAEKVEFSSSATVQTVNTPTYVAPVTPTLPMERSYTTNTKVRLVGSEFFQDQSTPAIQPVPAHAPAP